MELYAIESKWKISSYLWHIWTTNVYCIYTTDFSKISYNHVTFINLACETEHEILGIHNGPILKGKFMYF